MEYKIVSHTPTAEVKKRLIQRYMGVSAGLTVNRLRIKDANNVVLGEATIGSSDWSGYTLTKTVTIAQAGNAVKFTLERQETTGASYEFYTYSLPQSLALNVNDQVTIRWTLGITSPDNSAFYIWTAMLDEIAGRDVFDLKIAKVAFMSAGELGDLSTDITLSADLTNMILAVQANVTPQETYLTDEVRLLNASDTVLMKIAKNIQFYYGYNYVVTLRIHF